MSQFPADDDLDAPGHRHRDVEIHTAGGPCYTRVHCPPLMKPADHRLVAPHLRAEDEFESLGRADVTATPDGMARCWAVVRSSPTVQGRAPW